MKYLIFILLSALFATLLLSCGSKADFTAVKFVCSCEERKAAALFVTTNMAAANNHSDEEMEDVIEQLEKTAVKLHCHQERVSVDNNNHPNVPNPDSCKTVFDY